MNTQPAPTPQPTPGPTNEPEVSKKRTRLQAYRILIYLNRLSSLPHVTCIGIPLLGARYSWPYYGRASSFHTING